MAPVSDVAVVGPSTAVPTTMRAAVLREFGPPEVLRVEDMRVPHLQAGEVLLKVSRVAVGRTLDLVARAGAGPFGRALTFPHVLGAEHVGVVAARATDVMFPSVGGRVAVFPVYHDILDEAAGPYPEAAPSVRMIGIHRQGAYAQFVAVPAVNVRLIPAGISDEDAVAVVLAGAVAMNQFDRAGGVGPGMNVLVSGAASALGSTTALLAQYLGAKVVATSRDPIKREILRQLGVENVVDLTDSRVPTRVREVFGGRAADIVVDNLASAELWPHLISNLAVGGVVVSSGAFIDGVVPLDLRALYLSSQRIVGVRTGTLASLDRVWPLLEQGFRGVVDRSFSLDETPAAHHYVARSSNVGRVTITL